MPNKGYAREKRINMGKKYSSYYSNLQILWKHTKNSLFINDIYLSNLYTLRLGKPTVAAHKSTLCQAKSRVPGPSSADSLDLRRTPCADSCSKLPRNPPTTDGRPAGNPIPHRFSSPHSRHPSCSKLGMTEFNHSSTRQSLKFRHSVKSGG